MTDLAARLDDLRGHLAFPDATGVADAVHRRIAASSRPHADRRLLLVAAAVVVVIVLSAVLAIPASRHAVADWLGLRGVTIETTDRPSDALDVAGSDLRLGRSVTLAEARRAVDFPITVPDVDATPTVFVATRPVGGRVSFLYPPSDTRPAAGRPDVGLLVTELAARLDTDIFRKVVGTDTGIEPVAIDGRRGYWISGGPHSVGLVGRDGTLYRATTRLAADTLLLEDGERTLRIESALDRNAATEIARSLLRD